MGGAMLLQMRGARFDASREAVDEMRRSLDVVYRQGAIYEELRRQKESRESKISDQRLEFTILVEKASKALENGNLSDEVEKPDLPLGGGLQKRLYSFDVKDVTLEVLLKFLEELENQRDHIVHTDRLRIASPSEVEDRLNVEVDLATWQLVRKTEAPEESSS